MAIMNRLPPERRAHILHLLCEGMSIRAITRTTGASKTTVSKLLNDVGVACAEYYDKHVVGLRCRRVQVDEIWAFVYAKQKNVGPPRPLQMALVMPGPGRRSMPIPSLL